MFQTACHLTNIYWSHYVLTSLFMATKYSPLITKASWSSKISSILYSPFHLTGTLVFQIYTWLAPQIICLCWEIFSLKRSSKNTLFSNPNPSQASSDFPSIKYLLPPDFQKVLTPTWIYIYYIIVYYLHPVYALFTYPASLVWKVLGGKDFCPCGMHGI